MSSLTVSDAGFLGLFDLSRPDLAVVQSARAQTGASAAVETLIGVIDYRGLRGLTCAAQTKKVAGGIL